METTLKRFRAVAHKLGNTQRRVVHPVWCRKLLGMPLSSDVEEDADLGDEVEVGDPESEDLSDFQAELELEVDKAMAAPPTASPTTPVFTTEVATPAPA